MRFDVETKLFVDENTNANKIAFVAADSTLSWQQLKTLSDKICEVFKLANISAGNCVLVYGDKEAFFLAAMLSCYRMNLPFVPLSPSLPEKRVKKIIEQTQSHVLINCGNYKNIPALPTCINYDFSFNNKPSPDLPSVYDGIGYLLFTSGSSGEPKGVKISNKNIVAFTKWFTQHFNVNEKTVFINHADFSFDISLVDFFGTLQTGGTSIFNTSNVSNNTVLLFERINTHKGTYWNSTPSFISRCLADKNFNARTLPNITQFVLSGENLWTQLVKDLKARFPQSKIINAYGPTETTIYAGFAEITNELLNEPALPICKTNNAFISLKNNEIIISGNTVGSGYLNNEALTKERFLKKQQTNLYCTGDLAFEKNGYIYFNGRKDGQIKFNGYRIELNEIKQTLENIDFVEQAECLPVIVHEKVKRLIAFVKITSDNKTNAIAQKLKAELPHYMLPSEIIVLKEFPLTASAKVDKQRLLADYLGF